MPFLYCKVVTLGTLGMPKKLASNCSISLELSWEVHLHPKNQENSSKQNCRFAISYTLGIPRHAQPQPPRKIESTCQENWCLYVCKKSTLSPASFIRYHTLKNHTILLSESILIYNSRTKILPDIRFVKKYWKQYDLRSLISFQIISRKI